MKTLRSETALIKAVQKLADIKKQPKKGALPVDVRTARMHILIEIKKITSEIWETL